MTHTEQFEYIENARHTILSWARSQQIPLHRVEYVVPFVDMDFSLSAWLFFETDDQLRQQRTIRRLATIKNTFKGILQSLGYAPEWIREIGFVFDSHENVERNYEGNYFYRLR